MNADNQAIRESMLKKFDGCDSIDPGSPESPSIWLFGIEPGWSKNDQESAADQKSNQDDCYSIQTQIKWPFNRNAFKLLAAMHGNGYSVKTYKEFAEKFQPFVHDSKGYFKGNLYPYACNNVHEWHEYAARETGFPDKKSYLQWCSDYRFPEVKNWVDEYQPKVFIGVGSTYRADFSRAFFGEAVELKEEIFSVNGHGKRIFYTKVAGKTLFVIPHLSGGKNGLNSNESIRLAGEFIANFLSTSS